MWTPQELQVFIKAVNTIPESSRKVDTISEVMQKPREEVAIQYEKFIQIQGNDAKIVQNSAWSISERQRFQFACSIIPNCEDKLLTLSALLEKPYHEICAHLMELSTNTTPPMESNNPSAWSFQDIHRCELARAKTPIGIEDRMNVIATMINKPLNEVVSFCSLLEPIPTNVVDQPIIPLPEKNTGHWTTAEHDIFVQALETCQRVNGRISWQAMSNIVTTRTSRQIKDHYDKVVKKRI